MFKDLAKQVILFIPCFLKDIFILLLCTPNFELKICLHNYNLFHFGWGLCMGVVGLQSGA